MRPSCCSCAAACRVGSIRARHQASSALPAAFASARGISEGQQDFSGPRFFSIFKIFSLRVLALTLLPVLVRCLFAPSAPQPVSRANSCSAAVAARPFASNTTPSASSIRFFLCTLADSAPVAPAKPPRVRSDARTRCHGISAHGYGFLLIAPPTARAQVPSCFATAP